MANVVATNIKPRDFSGDIVDHALERVSPEVSAVAKDASLRMIAGLDQLEDFADRKYLALAMSKSSQVSARNQRGARISSNQFFNGANPVAGDRREDLFRDRKDLPASFAGKAEIKNPGFMPSVCVTLKHHRRLHLFQVIERITPRCYQSHT